MKKHKKFHLKCTLCGFEVENFAQWFESAQRCPECGSNRADVIYNDNKSNLRDLIDTKFSQPVGLWYYFDFLPLNRKGNIITAGEGIVPIDRWNFLERFARERYNIDCQVYAHRHDDNYATGTFKDLAGSVVASVLKETGIRNYVVSSTGNIGVAYSRYLTAAGISLYAFIPQNASHSQEAEIGCFGQKVFRVAGDYTRAKELGLEFSQKFNFPLAAGNFDPMRIEAKKTMVYAWLRLLKEFPTVYIQALSGGTGPLGIVKGCQELEGLNLFKSIPRFIMVQSEKCRPMADAWHTAKTNHFPEGWEKSYPIYHDPETLIPTLATGYPKTYPVLAPLVRESGGEIISYDEAKTANVARLIAYESSVRIGPAAAIAVGGYFKSLEEGHIKDGDIVLLNIGEGIRRSPGFLERLIYTTTNVSSIDECVTFDRKKLRSQDWFTV